MHHVFISYSRRDRAAIDDLVIALQAADDFQIWIDERDIPVSVPWFDEIEDAIRGAALVLVCESFAWHESPNCLVEGERAKDLAKPILYIDAKDHDTSATVADVRRHLHVNQAGAAAAELLVRAARWDRDGRRSWDVASRRALRSYLPVAAQYGDRLPADARTFLTRSRTCQRRRRILTVAGSLVVVTLLAVQQLFNGVQNKIKDEVSTADQSLEYYSQSAELARYDIYAELEDASHTPTNTNDSFASRDRLIADLGVPVPVMFSARTGTPRPPFAGVPNRFAVVRGGRTATVDGASGILTISQENAVTGRVQLDAGACALAWSHNGAILAAATSRGVQLVNADDGEIITTLGGFPRLVGSLSWSSDDRQITAYATNGASATWDVTSATVISQNPADWFVGVAAARGTDDAVALTRDGRVVVIDERKAEVVWRTSLPTGVYVGVTARGNEAIIARSELAGGTPSAVIVGLDDHSVREIPLPGCEPRGVSADSRQSDAAVACGESGYGFLDLTNGHLTVRHSPVAIISSAWTTDAALFGTIEGSIEQTSISGGVATTIFNNSCAGGVEHLATTPDGQHIVQAGDGADAIGCVHRGNRVSDGSWQFDVTAFRAQPGWQAGAIATSPDGRFAAYGFSDGTVRTFDVAELDPRAMHQDALGEVRGLAYSDDGHSLIAVTRDGEILAYSTAQDAMTISGLDKLAAARVAAARMAGVH